MTQYGKITYRGDSGSDYEFTVYSSDTSFDKMGAVYIITNRHQNISGGHSHSLIYIGQTGDLSEGFAKHQKQGCFALHNYNCILVYRKDNEKVRMFVESDLLGKHAPLCNR